jgi:cysteinyl-tRNA synthetase
MLKIYNSLSKTKEEFKPIRPNKIGMYVCGITVYDYCHIGHARMLVAFDVIVRYLRARGYEVNYVRNITDIDDKIIKRAQEKNLPFTEITAKYIKAMREDEQALNILPPDQEPLATDHMPEIIHMIQVLIDNKNAYIAENGDVYYSVNSFAKYGHLAHKDLEGLRVGARVEVTDAKQDPLDFVLWKLAKPEEPQWDSPWGAGRPGWHIECSAMSIECLGNHFDIHGGGFDLQFPHHENEIAQSEGATKEKFVNLWIHSGFVVVNKEKMSKSLGNFFTIREVLEKYPAEVVRYFLLSSHYRSHINYSQESLEFATSALERFYTALRDLPQVAAPENSEQELRFHATMDDDFNTPEAIAVMFEITREINRLRDTDISKAATLGALLRKFGNVLGILQQDPQTFLQGNAATINTQEVEKLIAERNQARVDKDWAKADSIRDTLLSNGVSLEDKAGVTLWRFEKNKT